MAINTYNIHGEKVKDKLAAACHVFSGVKTERKRKLIPAQILIKNVMLTTDLKCFWTDDFFF